MFWRPWLRSSLCAISMSISYQRLHLVSLWVELSLSYGQRSVDQFVLVSGPPLGPWPDFILILSLVTTACFFSSCREPSLMRGWACNLQSKPDWSGHWGLISIHYRLIWDCVLSSSPLTTRRDYGGGAFSDISMNLSPHLPSRQPTSVCADIGPTTCLPDSSPL
jgi:hypothetical protein